MEALFFTLIDDAHEGHKVVTFDVPRAYLNSDMSNYKSILINPMGGFVDIMCQVNPQYEQHARYKNGEFVLFILVIGAIYGFIVYVIL